MKIKHIAVILIVLGFLQGCAGRPIEEMNNATEAVTRAENDADAVKYAGGTVARAQEALRRMQDNADSKRYDAARVNAAEAISLAEKAIEEGKSGVSVAANEAANEAAALIAALKPAIAETGQAISNAKIAGLDIDFNAMDRDLENVRSLTGQAESALSASQYSQALDSGRNARANLGDINIRLTTAVTAASPKK